MRVSNRVFWAIVFLSGCAILSHHVDGQGTRLTGMEKISAKEIDIVGKSGQPLIRLGAHADKDDAAYLTMFAPDGGLAYSLTTDKDGTSLFLFSHDAKGNQEDKGEIDIVTNKSHSAVTTNFEDSFARMSAASTSSGTLRVGRGKEAKIFTASAEESSGR